MNDGAGIRSHGEVVAIVRPPDAALARCQLTHLERVPIDTRLARAQHDAYAALLRKLGARVVELEPEPELPDAVFVEDVAIVLDEIAILTCPGAESRRPEVESVAHALATFRTLAPVRPPGTLDGGDVLLDRNTLYVGRSGRTNDTGIRQLRDIVAPFGYQVLAVPLAGCLHLKSACTAPAPGLFLLNPDWIDPQRFHGDRCIHVHPDEPRAANTFRIGDVVVMADAFPRTRQALVDFGLDVRTTDLSELQKAEAGGSCMSLVFRA
ncbi:MAG: arginine deiminase-related protein [Gemmatimonadota bacterium]